TLAVALVFTVVVAAHVSLVVERRGRFGLLTGLLRRFGRVELGVDNLAVEPKRGQFRTHPFRFTIQVVTADAVGRERLGRLVHLFFVEVTDKAFLVAGSALFDALRESHAADGYRLRVLIVAGSALKVVLLFEFALVFENLFVRLRRLEVARVVAVRVMVEELRFRSRRRIGEDADVFLHIPQGVRAVAYPAHLRIFGPRGHEMALNTGGVGDFVAGL